MKRAPRRWRGAGLRAILPALCLGALQVALQPVAAQAATTVPSNSFVRLEGGLPNYLYSLSKQYGNSPPAGGYAYVSALLDPSRHRLFELGSGSCPHAVSVDTETYALQAIDPDFAHDRHCGEHPIAMTNVGTSQVAVAAIDTADGLLLIPGYGQIQVISEANLATIANWPIPNPPAPVAGTSLNLVTGALGVSWDPLTDELIGLGSGVSGGAPVGVWAIDIRASLKAHQEVPVFAYGLQTCANNIGPYFNQDAAYRGRLEPALFLACSFSAVLGQGERDGIVKVALKNAAHGGKCLPTAPAGSLCPTGARSDEAVAVEPGGGQAFNDLLFDPVSEHGFMPQPTSAGDILLVYDGPDAAFEGRAQVASAADQQLIVFGYDATQGRLYSVTHQAGTYAIDIRRNPVSEGSHFTGSQFEDFVDHVVLPVLPPSPAHPYARILAPDMNRPAAFTVYGDSRPISADAPLSALDANTYSGAAPAGKQVSLSYSGAGRGYGVHSDFVGGAAGLLGDLGSNNTSLGTLGETLGGQLPASRRTTDLLAGYVERTQVANGSSLASAAALGDGNGASAGDLANDTDSSRLGGNTTQEWPYPDAACSQPGPSATDSKIGEYSTTYGSDGSPQQQQIAGTSQDGSASVDCVARTGSAGASGLATKGQFSLSSAISSLPVVSADFSYVEVKVYPAAPGRPQRSVVSSLARGVAVTLPDGEQISFGDVRQTVSAHAGGIFGSAGTTREVIVDHFAIDGDQRCATDCDLRSVVAQINSFFPGLVEAVVPEPDPAYAAGSPGGYIAGIQSSAGQQVADEQFNEMAPEEASILPGLRLFLDDPKDGQPTINREVLDLAGAEADAEEGLQYFGEPGAVQGLTIQQIDQLLGELPGGPGQVARGSGGSPAQGAVERVFTGFGWLLRNPLGWVVMLQFYAVFAVPILMARRRWGWGR